MAIFDDDEALVRVLQKDIPVSPTIVGCSRAQPLESAQSRDRLPCERRPATTFFLSKGTVVDHADSGSRRLPSTLHVVGRTRGTSTRLSTTVGEYESRAVVYNFTISVSPPANIFLRYDWVASSQSFGSECEPGSASPRNPHARRKAGKARQHTTPTPPIVISG